MNVRWCLLLAMNAGCAFISDKHAAWREDPDGDGVAWTEDCDEGNASSSAPTDWYMDADADGFGREDEVRQACAQPDGYVAVAGDCNDDDAAIAPGTADGCNAVDDDCDGQIDEDAATQQWYLDKDEDGFGDADDVVLNCQQPDGRVNDDTDCDDDNAAANPGQSEVCDEADNDCDGDIDEDIGDLPIWYLDSDGDGYGDPANSIEACTVPDGYEDNGDDCDDENAALHLEGDEEIPYNGVDDNCSAIDGDGDADGDGFWVDDYADRVPADPGPLPVPEGLSGDCNDDPEEAGGSIYPGAVDFPYDGIDAGCGGDDDFDQDGDGYVPDGYEGLPTTGVEGSGGLPGGDCNDVVDTGGASAYPGAADDWYDGVDSDCGGEDDFDQDGDGFATDEHTYSATVGVDGSGVLPGGDCDDTDPSRNPGVSEDCTTDEDDNCDGETNDPDALDCEVLYTDADGDDYGDPATELCLCEETDSHTTSIGGDCDDDEDSAYPGAADTWYDGLDFDCDGEDDYDADSDGYVPGGYEGLPTEGVPGSGGLAGGDCDDGAGDVNPSITEICDDGIDNNCDGLAEVCDPLVALLLTGATDGDRAGAALGVVGDLAIIGAPAHDGGGESAGAVYLTSLDVRGEVDLSTAPTELTGSGAGDQLGHAVLGIPTESGPDRFAVSAPEAGVGGAVYVLSPDTGDGSASAASVLTVAGLDDASVFGDALAVGVGLDGTEERQLVIAAPGDDAMVWVMPLDVTGSTSVSSAVASIRFDEESFGTSILALDMTGDGDDELLVGGPKYDDAFGGEDVGAVFSYQGPMSGEIEWDDFTAGIIGETQYDLMGTAIANPGDINGDGTPDLAIGAAQAGSTLADDDPGAVYIATEPSVFALGPSSLDPYATLWGEIADDWTGGSVMSGDFDGDGSADLAIGAKDADVIEVREGRVYVFLGPLESGSYELADDADMILEGTGSDASLGTALMRIPDRNEDGGDELLLGAPYDADTTDQRGTISLILSTDVVSADPS